MTVTFNGEQLSIPGQDTAAFVSALLVILVARGVLTEADVHSVVRIANEVAKGDRVL